jgi:hypothetical protein
MYVAVIAVGAGIAMLGGVAAVQAARKAATTKAERAQVRLERQKRLGKHVRKAGSVKRQGKSPDNVFGTITYEPGAPADAFASEPGGNNVVSNRFNSALGAPLRPGNLTGATFFPGIVQGTAVISVMGPPAGGQATIIGVTYLTGIAGNTFNTINIGPFGVGADFMAGMYVGAFGGTDQIGLRNASVNGQGFHGVQMNFVGTNTATGVVPLPGQNAMFRASGNLLVPVELMDFKLE